MGEGSDREITVGSKFSAEIWVNRGTDVSHLQSVMTPIRNVEFKLNIMFVVRGACAFGTLII